MGKEANDAIISSFFSFCGGIVSIDIHDGKTPDTNEVIITFDSHDAAKTAEVLSNTAFLDNTIVITPYFKEGQGESAPAASPEAKDSAKPSENALPAEEKKGDNSNNDGNNGDDDDDGKDEAATKPAPANNSTETTAETAPAEASKESTDNNNNNSGKEEKGEKVNQDSEGNGNSDDGSVVHKLGEIVADGRLMSEDLKKYDEAMGISEGIKNGAAAVDNALGLSSAFTAASSFLGSQLKEIDQQTGISQAAGKLMSEVSESPYFASTFSMFRGWGASISKAYNAIYTESNTILEEKKTSESSADANQQKPSNE